MKTYSVTDCLDDFFTLAEHASGTIQKIGMLSTCCVCGEKANAMVASESGGIASLCMAHIEATSDNWKLTKHNQLVIPETLERRAELIQTLRAAYVADLKEHLPFVMRLLKVDSLEEYLAPLLAIGAPMALVVDSKAARFGPFPWRQDDGFLLGGLVAADAAVIVESIRAGRTTAECFGGAWLFTSDDTELLSEVSV